MYEHDCRETNEAGFSLVEVLIAIVIMGLAVGIVTVNISRLTDQARSKSEIDSVQLVISKARALSVERSETISLDLVRLELLDPGKPGTDRVRFSEDAVIKPPGFCVGGGGRIRIKGIESSFRIEPASCKIVF